MSNEHQEGLGAVATSEEAINKKLIDLPPAFPVIVSGPSGVGKTSIVQNALLQRTEWRASVSVTTRDLRVGETIGKAYEFVTRSEFEKMRISGGFVETAGLANS